MFRIDTHRYGPYEVCVVGHGCCVGSSAASATQPLQHCFRGGWSTLGIPAQHSGTNRANSRATHSP